MIESALEWFESRDAESIITYNGDGFDFIHLRGRAEIASNAAGERTELPDRADALLADSKAMTSNARGRSPSDSRTGQRCLS